MNTFLIRHTVHYLLTSGHKFGHRIHSPFVYDLICSVFRAKPSNKLFGAIESRRRSLLRNTREITIKDFGAGSKQNASNVRKVCYIARTSLSKGKYARLLYNIMYRYKPQQVIELGTSLGIGTAYMASGCPEASVVTLEGSETIADIARETFHECNITNVEVVVGRFDDTLPGVLQKMGEVDCAFVDGNHTKEATLRYFEQIYPYCKSSSFLIFDDISWSEGMYEAWQTIVSDCRVRISIDLGKKGIVFFREGIEKQHFTIRY